MEMQRTNPRWFASFAIVAVLVVSGCQTMSGTHRATPVEQGSVEVAGAASGSHSTFSRNHPMQEALAVPFASFAGGRAPLPEGNVRVGATDRLDFGVRGNLQGFGGDLNYAPIVGPDFALSINPKFVHQRFSVYDCGVLLDCFDYKHHVSKGGAAILADVAKTNLVTATLGTEAGVWWDREERVSGDSSATESTRASSRTSPASSPYLELKAGLEIAHRDAFVRADYGTRSFVLGRQPSRGSHQQTMTIATGYRF